MAKEIVCYRCGKVHDLNYKTVKQTISCPHCHAKMTFDIRSIKKMRWMRYLFIILIVTPIILGFQLLEQDNNYLILIFTCMIAMVLSMWSDQLCMYLTYKYMNINYVECHPEDKKKPTKVKNSQKKGRRKWISLKD